MGMYLWVLFAHVCGVTLYVGGDVFLNVIALHALRKNRPILLVEVAKQATPAVSTGAGLTVLSGTALVFINTAWHFSSTWVISGIAMVFIVSTAKNIYFRRQLSQIESVVTSRGPEDPEVVGRLRGVVWAATLVNVLFFAVIWLMMFKPNI